MALSPPPDFHTRQYRYDLPRAAPGVPPTKAVTELPRGTALSAGSVYRFLLGRDRFPVKLSLDEVRRTLHDPFAALVLGPGKTPTTLRALLAALDVHNGSRDGLGTQRAFVVADGGQLPWTKETADVDRSLRLLISRAPTKGEAIPDLFVSTTGPFDSETVFLQVVGWDPDRGAFQFYDRREGAWIHAGCSWDALSPDTRGKGPFDSHVNGALNMKELKRPWLHWHSMSAGIPESALAPDDPLHRDPLWQQRAGAEQLELEIIRPEIRRWVEARIAASVKDRTLTRLPELLRQVLTTSTLNLITSPVENGQLSAGAPVPLPLTFFLDSDALVDDLGLDPGLSAPPAVPGAHYQACLKRYDVHLSDGKRRFPGDTHFLFLVPERAFEDQVVLQELRRRRILSDKLAAALLMVDFPNPVFSRRREALLAHVPDHASAPDAGESDFGPAFLRSVERGAKAGSPERELLDLWKLPESGWRARFEATLKAYFGEVGKRLGTLDGFAPLFELAESRRREFRKRPLAEFSLTTPRTNLPEKADPLELTASGKVQPKPKAA